MLSEYCWGRGGGGLHPELVFIVNQSPGSRPWVSSASFHAIHKLRQNFQDFHLAQFLARFLSVFKNPCLAMDVCTHISASSPAHTKTGALFKRGALREGSPCLIRLPYSYIYTITV